MKRLLLMKLLVFALIPTVITVLAGCTSTETNTESVEKGAVEQTTEVKNVSAQEAYTLVQENLDNPDFVIIDVRTPDEYNDGHVEGAVNIDYNSDAFRDKTDGLDKNKDYLVYCRSGSRSSAAVKIMEELGFTMIYHMNGGILDWNSESLPLAR